MWPMVRAGCGALLLIVVSAGVASAAVCAETCRSQGREYGWKRAEVVGCTKACKREQRKCRGLRGADRRACQADLGPCAGTCAGMWPVGEARTDREYCQFICSECGRDLATFCIEGPTRVARCCGREGEGPCCSHLAAPDPPECCAVGDTCCTRGCIDTRSDPANCGDCDLHCAVGETCNDGTCRPPSCDEPPSGIRTMTRTIRTRDSGGNARVLTTIGTYDPCVPLPGGGCQGETTLECTIDGADTECKAGDIGFAASSLFADAVTRGVFCAAVGVSCAGTCAVDVGIDHYEYACTGCVATGCEAPLEAACECFGPGGCVFPFSSEAVVPE